MTITKHTVLGSISVERATVFFGLVNTPFQFNSLERFCRHLDVGPLNVLIIRSRKTKRYRYETRMGETISTKIAFVSTFEEEGGKHPFLDKRLKKAVQLLHVPQICDVRNRCARRR